MDDGATVVMEQHAMEPVEILVRSWDAFSIEPPLAQQLKALFEPEKIQAGSAWIVAQGREKEIHDYLQQCLKLMSEHMEGCDTRSLEKEEQETIVDWLRGAMHHSKYPYKDTLLVEALIEKVRASEGRRAVLVRAVIASVWLFDLALKDHISPDEQQCRELAKEILRRAASKEEVQRQLARVFFNTVTAKSYRVWHDGQAIQSQSDQGAGPAASSPGLSQPSSSLRGEGTPIARCPREDATAPPGPNDTRRGAGAATSDSRSCASDAAKGASSIGLPPTKIELTTIESSNRGEESKSAAGSRPEEPCEPTGQSLPPPVPSGPPPDLWGWEPLPEEPDPHSEYDFRSMPIAAGGVVIGARVRGKQHKHKGTNCDDWFEFGTAGDWTIVAASDGAGSARFSRVGSRTACRAVVDYLSKHLKSTPVPRRVDWTGEDLASDVHGLQGIMAAAFLEAVTAVETEWARRHTDRAHVDVVGRKLEFRDFYCTLLVTIHARDVWGVKGPDDRRDLVLSCAVGDGMIAVIGAMGSERRLQLMMTPDSGQFSGETEFLTRKIVEAEDFVTRVKSYIGPVEAILAMTDGVADDYFPNDPGMVRLYADLLLNGVATRHPSEARCRKAWAESGKDPGGLTEEDDPAELQERKIGRRKPSPTPSVESDAALDGDANRPPEPIPVPELDPKSLIETEDVFVRYLERVADWFGIEATELLGRPDLMEELSRKGRPLTVKGGPREEKLMKWLDAYRVRGSFDDRTLVLLSTLDTRSS